MIKWINKFRGTRRRDVASKKSAIVCSHVEPDGAPSTLCRRYGCPDDPSWRGDGCRS